MSGRQDRDRDASTGGQAFGAHQNLVLQADRTARRHDEPTGEVSSLSGRISIRDMGSRAQRDVSQLEKYKEDNAGDRERRDKKKITSDANKLGTEYTSILEATEDIEGLRYRPRTIETRAAYEQILSFAAGKLGDVDQAVLRSAADVLLEVLRGDLTDADKRAEASAILGVKLTTEELGVAVNLAKKLVDYDAVVGGAGSAAGANGADLDEQLGVAVIFEDEDDEDDGGADGTRGLVDDDEVAANPFEVPAFNDDDDTGDNGNRLRNAGAEGSDDDNQNGDDAADPSHRRRRRTADAAFDGDAELDQVVFDDARSRTRRAGAASDGPRFVPQDVDAFWLQRQVTAVLDDAHLAQQKAQAAFDVLQEHGDDMRACENALLELFEFDHFDLVKLLTANALAIVACTQLAKAGDDTDRASVIADMRAAGLFSVLAQLGLGKARDESLMDVDDDLKSRTASKPAAAAAADASAAAAAAASDDLAPKAVIDLDSMAFSNGAHTMTNKSVKLPAGSFKRPKPGYEEIHVPAPAAPAMADNERLIPIAELPEWAQRAFPNTTSLNRVQSTLYVTAFTTQENMLICAPTGAGKTNSAMLTVLGLLGEYRNERTGDIALDAFKIVYVAPMKALVQEMVGNFERRLKPYGIKVGELTGDSQMNKQQLQETQMIVTTPEKWDVITRKGTDRSYTSLVRLIIIDEVHLLHDDRGPVIESIVARTLRHSEHTRDHVRMVGLSATLPNYHDVAAFMRVKASGLYYFDSSYRPCPLQQQYIGITEKKALKRFQVMNVVTYEKVEEQMGKNQVLVFVHSRKDTAKTGKQLRDLAIENGTIGKLISSDKSRQVLNLEVENVQDKDLKELLPYGIGIHHAGLTRSDRTLVEELFGDGHLQVLCSTATLAWGVNLPAHTVIIKGTQVYSPEKGKWVELSPQDVLQMLGRAGRPQFDTFGEGIIITTHSELQYYLSLLNAQLPIESQMVSKLGDVLNAELVLGSIASRADAAEWLSYTYLHVRMLRSPGVYGIDVAEAEADPKLVQRRMDLVHSALAMLEKHLMIKYDRRTGKIASTDLGRIAAHYYISTTSMAMYHQQLRPESTLIDVFRVFALSSEFKYIPVREEEKMELQKLAERVPIPIKEGADEPTAKINVLLQTFISQLKLEGYSLMSDMVYVTQSAQRLFRALFEMSLRRGWARLARVTLDACKMVEKRQWSSMTPLRQFKAIPAEVIRRLEKKELSFSRYHDLTPEELGEHVGAARFGKLLHKFVHSVPRVELTVRPVPVSRSLIKVDLTLQADFAWDMKLHGGVQGFHVWVSDVDDENLLYHDYFLLKAKYVEERHTLTFTVPLFEPLAPNYFISVVSDSWLASTTRMPVSFRSLLLPAKFAPPTQLHDLQPLPVAALERHAGLFSYEHFNPIQTQVFHSVYKTDENCLVCAPAGSGKTVIAEWAVIRALYHRERTADQRIVYMAPYDAIAAIRFRQWSTKFGSKFNVVLLTGQTTRDLQLLERADLVIATAAHWDALSRRWHQRKQVYNTWLFIADEMHLMADPEVGVAMEIVCTRMRTISLRRQEDGTGKVRMLVLAASMANANDIGGWLLCEPNHTYNFAPSARPHPLPVTIQAFAIQHVPSLLLAMIKPAYAHLSQLGPREQAIAFVSGRAQCAVVATELAAWLAPGQTFLRVDSESKDFVGMTSDLEPALAQSLEVGIGWVYENMSARDMRTVLSLYESGAIGVLLATRLACWHLEEQSCAHVLILGTQYYDGQYHVYADYPIADVLHMLGRGTSRAHLMTLATKKDYFKRYLSEPVVVESLLDHRTIHDHLNAEIVTRNIKNMQEAVDYLTWTLMYRRITLNPNFYGLLGLTETHLSDFLTELVEEAVGDLNKAKCIELEDEFDLKPLNLGMIAAYYCVSTETVEMLALSIRNDTKVRGLLEIISHAVELSYLPVRHHEAGVLRKLYDQVCPAKLGGDVWFSDPQVKAHILLQCHFGRVQLPVDLQSDLRFVLRETLPLLYAAVDVISGHGWLPVALAAMELCQMCVQGLWDKDSPLQQLPHVQREHLALFRDAGVESVFDLMELEEDAQQALFSAYSAAQTGEIVTFVNAYPGLEVDFSVDGDDAVANAPIACRVAIRREDEDATGDAVVAPLFPTEKSESWWLVVGDKRSRALYGVKRVTVGSELNVRLDFVVPRAGSHDLALYLMCDSYLGCDQEFAFKVDVAEGDDSDEDDEDEDEEGDAMEVDQ
ncbi:Sec63 Brl domain-containing protein [Blastocladiella britannica]|nr:Sec63 Brl domain-containing protein [Blastocladiella britannica]